MIEINLLPEELKTKSKKIYAEPKYFLYLVLSFVGILIVIHICLFLVSILIGYNFNVLNNKWQRLVPQRKILEDFKNKYALVSADTVLIQQLTRQQVNWSEKLNKISLDLPAGIWFNEVSLSAKNLFLKGSAVSLQKEEMNLINKFIDNLKKDQDFFSDFNNLELTSVQRRIIGSYEIVDFVLVGTLNDKPSRIR
jgi:Tfp pilus assembly protein PilN